MEPTGPDVTGRGGEVAAARRRAGIVAAVAGLALTPYFWLTTTVVGWPGRDAPPMDAPAHHFVEFYVNGFSRIPVTASAAIGAWALWLLLVVSVVRATGRRFDLAAVFAVSLAGAAIAVYTAAEGVLAWPTIGTTASQISEHLDPGVAQAMVMSRDGLHAAASVLLGISMLVVAWLLARSDVWARWALAVAGSLAGMSACAAMIVGPEGLGAGAIMLWGVMVAVLFLVGMRRNLPPIGDDT